MKHLLLLSVISIFASCSSSLRYYTKDIHDDGRWTDSELKKIQFYLSDDIVLWRDINRGETEIINGKIRLVEGRNVEEVSIRKGTPGIFRFSPQKNHFAVSFDEKDDSRFLVFAPSREVDGRFVLLAKNWDKSYGKVTYGDKLFTTSNKSAFVFLMADIDKIQKTVVTSSIPRGRKVE